MGLQDWHSRLPSLVCADNPVQKATQIDRIVGYYGQDIEGDIKFEEGGIGEGR